MAGPGSPMVVVSLAGDRAGRRCLKGRPVSRAGGVAEGGELSRTYHTTQGKQEMRRISIFEESHAIVSYVSRMVSPKPFTEEHRLMLLSATKPFLEHLRLRLKLTEGELPEVGEWSGVGNTIGALALRLNLVTVEQLDQILGAQEEDENGRRFGDVAIELGFLDEGQVR